MMESIVEHHAISNLIGNHIMVAMPVGRGGGAWWGRKPLLNTEGGVGCGGHEGLQELGQPLRMTDWDISKKAQPNR